LDSPKQLFLNTGEFDEFHSNEFDIFFEFFLERNNRQ
jgi:hypothetical protein